MVCLWQCNGVGRAVPSTDAGAPVVGGVVGVVGIPVAVTGAPHVVSAVVAGDAREGVGLAPFRCLPGTHPLAALPLTPSTVRRYVVVG